MTKSDALFIRGLLFLIVGNTTSFELFAILMYVLTVINCLLAIVVMRIER